MKTVDKYILFVKLANKKYISSPVRQNESAATIVFPDVDHIKYRHG
jgi:hypothetical protein